MGLFNNLFGKKEQGAPIVSDSWNVYHYMFGEEDEFMALISFDETVVDEAAQQGYANCIRVIFRLPQSDVTENGMPVPEAGKRLMGVEDVLIPALEQAKIDCRFVGKMTYYGMREFVFQVNDVAGFEKQIAETTQAYRQAYTIEIKKSDGWDFFNAKISPDEQARFQITDRVLIETLLKNGADPEKPHYFEHTFNGPAEALENIRRELAEESFDVLLFEGTTLSMAKRYSLDEEVIGQTTQFMVNMSQLFGCKYDGWGTEIER